MSENILEIEQRSDAWRRARLGKVTGSRIADVLAKIKSGEAAARRNYRADLVIERITGKSTDNFQTKAMLEGIEREPLARAHYEMISGKTVREVGFVLHPTIADAGCSPDGLIDEDGTIEAKCPQAAAHLDFLKTDKIPGEYLKQINWLFSCMPQRKWCHFISFNPDIEGFEFHWVRVGRDDALIAEMEKEVPIFLKEVADDVEALRKKFAVPGLIAA